jgi:sugar lactone lactonase YvrE
METPFSQKITCRVLSQLGFASLLVLAVLFVPLSHAQSDYATPYTFTTFAGTAGVNGNADGTGAAAQFQFPNGVAVDASGNVYVTDSSSEYTGAVGETIRKITPAGVVTTLAGVAGVIGSTDGTGTSAQFNNPFGIAVDGSGNLYIGDTNNDTIRKVTPAGVVTTLAGTARVPGSAGGTGAAARFNNPYGVAVDESGNVYVADCGNNTIRKIAISSGVVTTVAGTAGVSGSADGTGVAARFSSPTGITVDGDGNLYVADGDNCTIRKISPSGAVTTLAGTAGMVGDADGTGPAARFALPGGIAVDGNGNLFVTDDENFLIRKITPSGVVTTLAGTPPPIRGQANGGSADGTGAAAQFYYPSGIAVDGNGYLYVADSFNYTIRKGYAAAGTPQIQAQPTDQYTAVGGSATFSVTASGSGTLAYQWNFNGSAIAGATGSSYTVANAQASNDGPYTVTVTNSFGSVTSSAGTLYVNTGSSGARLINIATRALVGTGGNVLIPGFVIGGSGSETLLIRADGPALTAFGVTGALAQPSMTLTSQATGATLATNTGWGTNTNPAQIASVAAQVGAFGLASGSADCAVIVTLQPGAYTVQVSGVGNTTGVALAEVYEVSYTGTARLINIATRAQVGTGGNILIPGFVIGGTGVEHLLVRGDGPALTAFGVAGALAQPSLVVTAQSTGATIGSNTGWGTNTNPTPAQIASIAASVGAFGLTSGSADSALVVNLQPGAYTIQISGVGGTTGVGLAEVYEVP